jgi:ABC-type glutathione transport system ATPase component
MNPRLLIRDEPTEGLAPIIVKQLHGAPKRLKADGLAVILVEQNLCFATSLADDVLAIGRGRVVWHGDAAHNPALPVTIAEQAESTQEAFEAGARIVHAHVRDESENPVSDSERFARLLEGLRRHAPDIIVQVSTGGRSGAGRDRGVRLRP